MGEIFNFYNFSTRSFILAHIFQLQCLIFHCRPLSRRSPARPAACTVLGSPRQHSWRLSPASGRSCHVENLNSSVYVYLANLQLQQSHTLLTVSRGLNYGYLIWFNFKSVVAFQAGNCETPVSCDNLPRDFLGLRSNVCPISSSFSSVST